jgi:pimeloyl-ACP methyl ester carboxylesterase
MLTIQGKSVDCQETGSGPAVLFIPGSFSTPAAWRPIQSLLPKKYHQIGTSLCGYGATEETRTADDFGMTHEVGVVAAVARHVGRPLHLVGHSFGGTVAFAAALAGVAEVLSIAVFEANPLALARTDGDTAAYDETREMSLAFEAACHAGEPDAAGRIIDYWGGAGSFAAMPGPVQDYCRRTARANVLDWHTAFGFQAGPADYAALAIPVLLVRGARANPVMISITGALEASLSNVRSAVVDGANHFLISSHAKACAGLLADFLEETDAGVCAADA